jgi:predicted dehydrogenase
MEKIRTGIIGYGNIGKKREIPLKKYKDYDIIARADIKEKVEYQNYTDMISKENLDAVFVCVPHTLTKDAVIYCLESGLNVFSEKPPGISYGEITEIKKIYEKNKDLKLAFGFNHRHFDHIQKAKNIISQNKFGRILWMRGLYGKSQLETWRQEQSLGGRGILLSQGIHMVDLMRFLMKKSAYSKGYEFENVKSFISHFDKNWYEDNAFALLRGQDIVAFLHSSCKMWKNTFKLNITMENGYIDINGMDSSTKSFGFPVSITTAFKETEFYGNPNEEVFYYGPDKSFEREVKQFIDVIKNNKYGDLATMNDACNVMRILEGIYEGKEINNRS